MLLLLDVCSQDAEKGVSGGQRGGYDRLKRTFAVYTLLYFSSEATFCANFFDM